MLSAYYAAGLMLIPMLPEAALCSVLRLPGLMQLLEELLLGSSGAGCLRCDALPAALHGATYGHLFDHYVRLGTTLPLGLFRAPPGAGALPYVVTNPPPTTVVAPTDKLLAVARPPSSLGARFLNPDSASAGPPPDMATPASAASAASPAKAPAVSPAKPPPPQSAPAPAPAPSAVASRPQSAAASQASGPSTCCSPKRPPNRGPTIKASKGAGRPAARCSDAETLVLK